MNEPVRTLLTGATGSLGRELRPRLHRAGHDVRATSRSPPSETDDHAEWVTFDLKDGTGLSDAVTGIDVVVHAASAPRGDSEAVDVRGTERLLEAAATAGVSNFVYVSIVGVDEIPYSYYEHKRAAERIVERSPVPATIVRATQFHEFVFGLLDGLSWAPIWPLPIDFQMQPIETGEAAAAIVDRATLEPAGWVPPVGGPEVRTVGELARAYRDSRSARRPIVPVPVPGAIARGFRAGEATCPERTMGSVTWKQWLEKTKTDSEQ
ncbi:nucleotide-diphosphate-sugar epimerase [Halostagnicola larsenii XH-48]|uniref:Nucleotide-diphosphate-sugar epimerase n=1 Tax=Halostagnicola larsenii XH-48 TaxID=797299 RepID=W0JNF3_9EURY|nr:NAD(P)H-binding protein [Halostagnicola larsenii]AHG00134.1 nucleotide-diphosphate-sugar epimerase [Halostagnicola larsenii XH-48]